MFTEDQIENLLKDFSRILEDKCLQVTKNLELNFRNLSSKLEKASLSVRQLDRQLKNFDMPSLTEDAQTRAPLGVLTEVSMRGFEARR